MAQKDELLLKLLPEEKEGLRQLAKANGTTMTWEARIAIQDSLRKNSYKIKKEANA